MGNYENDEPEKVKGKETPKKESPKAKKKDVDNKLKKAIKGGKTGKAGKSKKDKNAGVF